MTESKMRELSSLAMLFTSKAGGILVILIFMPKFYKLLGEEQFGIVSIILSLQALLMMIDLGMSTIVGRDVAYLGQQSIKALTTWRNAEKILTVFYALITIFVLTWTTISKPTELNMISSVLVVVLFWSLILQALSQAVLLNLKSFKLASCLQLFCALFRAGVTVISLEYINATLTIFITSQLVTSVINLMITRSVCNHLFNKNISESLKIKQSLAGCMTLLKRGKPLILFGLAGAAIMQLDKPIIGFFTTPNEVSSYFLAATFCMTPILILASPISQYFQPKIISLTADINSNQNEFRNTLSRFVVIITLTTIIPSTILWFYRNFLVELWLGHPIPNHMIAYIANLLPGIAIGALGFIPYALLTAVQDYHFQSRLSVAMSLITLVFIVYFAQQKNIHAIIISYAMYHVISTIASWTRTFYIRELRRHAINSFKLTLIIITSITLFSYVINILTSKYMNLLLGFLFHIIFATIFGTIILWAYFKVYNKLDS